MAFYEIIRGRLKFTSTTDQVLREILKDCGITEEKDWKWEKAGKEDVAFVSWPLSRAPMIHLDFLKGQFKSLVHEACVTTEALLGKKREFAALVHSIDPRYHILYGFMICGCTPKTLPIQLQNSGIYEATYECGIPKNTREETNAYIRVEWPTSEAADIESIEQFIKIRGKEHAVEESELSRLREKCLESAGNDIWWGNWEIQLKDGKLDVIAKHSSKHLQPPATSSVTPTPQQSPHGRAKSKTPQKPPPVRETWTSTSHNKVPGLPILSPVFPGSPGLRSVPPGSAPATHNNSPQSVRSSAFLTHSTRQPAPASASKPDPPLQPPPAATLKANQRVQLPPAATQDAHQLVQPQLAATQNARQWAQPPPPATLNPNQRDQPPSTATQDARQHNPYSGIGGRQGKTSKGKTRDKTKDKASKDNANKDRTRDKASKVKASKDTASKDQGGEVRRGCIIQ